MIKVGIDEILYSLQDANFLWIIIPIFFVGIITDKYQEEFGTDVGNAIGNGAMIIFTGFSWIQIISSRVTWKTDIVLSQYIFAFLIISYGLAIIASGFYGGEFAKKYGRIRVITFMLMFFTMMIYIPIFYNFVSILMFVFLFPFYYAFITELVKVMPSAKNGNVRSEKIEPKPENVKIGEVLKDKVKEYLK